MALKSSFFRNAILVGLFLCLARPTLRGVPVVSALAANWPSAPSASPYPQRPEDRNPNHVPTPDETAPPLTDKQKRSILRSNFVKMRRDVDELADLTKELQGELGKSNEQILSLEVMDKADKIEKLAKKIKASAHGT